MGEHSLGFVKRYRFIVSSAKGGLMHTGYTVVFQNPFNGLPDHEVYAEELRLCDLAVELGFKSLWTV